MRTLFCTAVCAIGLLAVAGTAQATEANLDFVVITNPTAAIFGDLFDDTLLDAPPWTPSGSPGPEAGGFLTMTGGDSITANFSADPQALLIAQASAQLTDFGPGSTLLISLGSGADSVGLAVTPTFSFVAAGGPLLGAVPLDPGGLVALTLGVTPGGAISAAVNGIPIYVGPGGPATLDTVTVQVIPEPAMLGALGLGSVALLRRRRP